MTDQRDDELERRVAALIRAGATEAEVRAFLREQDSLPPTQPADITVGKPTAGRGVPDPFGVRDLAKQFRTAPVRTLAGFGRAAAHGVTLGASDEVIGALRGLLGPGTLAEGVAKERMALQAFRARNPGTSLGTELAMGMGAAKLLRTALGAGARGAGPGRTGRVLTGLQEAALPTRAAPTTGRAIAQGAKSAALYGGLYGFNVGEGGVGPRLQSAALSTGLALPLGGLVGGLAHGIRRGGEKLVPRAKGLPSPSTVRKIQRAFAADQGAGPIRPPTAAGAVLADQGGPNVLSLLSEAARSPAGLVEGRQFATQRTAAVQGGLRQHTARLKDLVGTQKAALEEEVRRMVDQVTEIPTTTPGLTNPLLVAKALSARQQAAAAPLYDALRASNQTLEVTPTLAAVLQSPIVQRLGGKGLAEFEGNLQAADLVRTLRGGTAEGPLGPLGAPTVIPTSKGPPALIPSRERPQWQRLDLLKQRMDDVLSSAAGGKLGTKSRRAVRTLRAALVSELDAQVPGYEAARAAYAGPAQQSEARLAGQAASRKGANAVEAALVDLAEHRASPDAVTHFRVGVLAEQQQQIATRGLSVATKAFWTPDRKRIFQLIAPTEAKPLLDLVGSAETQLAAAHAATAENLAAAKQVARRWMEPARAIPSRVPGAMTQLGEREGGTVAGAGTAGLLGRGGLAIRYLTAAVARRFGRLPAGQAEEIARLLLDRDPSLASQILNQPHGPLGGTVERALGRGGGLMGRTVGALDQP